MIQLIDFFSLFLFDVVHVVVDAFLDCGGVEPIILGEEFQTAVVV
jgi:hypothetical protein